MISPTEILWRSADGCWSWNHGCPNERRHNLWWLIYALQVGTWTEVCVWLSWKAACLYNIAPKAHIKSNVETTLLCNVYVMTLGNFERTPCPAWREVLAVSVCWLMRATGLRAEGRVSYPREAGPHCKPALTDNTDQLRLSLNAIWRRLTKRNPATMLLFIKIK